MTPDLYRYAADRGALHWEVQQEIAEIKDSYRSDDRRPDGTTEGTPHSGGEGVTVENGQKTTVSLGD